MNDELFAVEDKVVVITGGLGQLGREFALTLADRGARVAVFDARSDQSVVQERFGSRAADPNLRFVRADVADRTSLHEGVARVLREWGPPHGLVNAAALDAPPGAPAGENGPFETYPESSFEEVMRINVNGVFLCCQVIGAEMAAAGRGSIVNVSSIYGMVAPDQRIYAYRAAEGAPFFKPVAYSVSKSALFNLTRYLAVYWAERNVRVNTVTFGGVFNNQDEQFLRGYCARVPLGRMARVNEYNGAIVFLLSDAASYMTGANLVLDGGWTAW